MTLCAYSIGALETLGDFATANGALAPAQPRTIPYTALRQIMLPPTTAIYSADVILTEVNDEVSTALRRKSASRGG